MTMQTLDIHHPEMPDLQFVLFAIALFTSRVTALNIPDTLRTAMFDRCWVLIHDSPPPRRADARVLDLMPWTQLTVEAMAEIIRAGLTEAGIHTLAWDHRHSEPTHTITREADIFIDRLTLYTLQATEPASGEAADATGNPPSGEGIGGAVAPQ
jgi:hypothetical protein